MATVESETTSAGALPGARAEQRLLLYGVDWAAYRKISEALTGTGASLAYDRGGLEIMTRSRLHELFKSIIDRIIALLAEELDLPLDTCGEMTCDREDLVRGIEPDYCYYITHEPDIRGRDRIDLRTDPPPDLAVEIDVSRSSRIRMPIYAALGVAEVWRFDGEALVFLRLGTNGQYAEVEHSLYFPSLSAADLLPFVLERARSNDITVVRSFRAWLRQRLGKKT